LLLVITLLKVINNNPNDVVKIAQNFNKWVNANGKPLKGLIKRRAAEAELFFKS
jgi:GH24 family phage-related lysozyme (muramidase)